MNADKPSEQPKQQSELDTRREDDELAFEHPAEGFKRGWQDILDGNTIPASKLLEALDEEI